MPLDAEDAALDRERDGLEALRDAESLEDARDVVLDRASGDPRPAGDLRVARAFDDQSEHRCSRNVSSSQGRRSVRRTTGGMPLPARRPTEESKP